MVASKPKPISMRNIVVVLPEDKMLKLTKAAEARGMTSHQFAADALLKAL